eukprot:13759850-Ditylum_brightwellii.AAC.1
MDDDNVRAANPRNCTLSNSANSLHSLFVTAMVINKLLHQPLPVKWGEMTANGQLLFGTLKGARQ